MIKTWANRSLIVGIIFSALSIAGLMADKHQFFHSYLPGFIFWFSIAIGGLFMLTLSHLIKAKFSMTLRPVYAAAIRTLPLFILFFLPIAAGLHDIFHHWARPYEELDAILRSKHAYLNEKFFYIRAVIYFLIWIPMGWVLTKPIYRGRDEHMDNRAAPFMIMLALTATFASIDWVMSLEPHWFSTIWGVLFSIGAMLAMHAFSIVVVSLLRTLRPDPIGFTIKRMHDLGTMMFAFIMLWAYMTLSQFLIIWSGNIPEEVIWFTNRITGGWGCVAVTGFFLHFAIPWLLLLTRWVKRNVPRLTAVAILMLFMGLYEQFWFIAPVFSPGKFHIHWLDLVLPIAIGGIWLSFFFRQLAIVPINAAGEAEGGHH